MWTWTPWLACVLIQMRDERKKSRYGRKYVIKDTKGTLGRADLISADKDLFMSFTVKGEIMIINL